MNDHQDAVRGDRARKLLDSDVFKEAKDAVEGFYRKAIFETAPDDAAAREALFMEYHAFRRVVKRLLDWEQSGQLAQATLDRE